MFNERLLPGKPAAREGYRFQTAKALGVYRKNQPKKATGSSLLDVLSLKKKNNLKRIQPEKATDSGLLRF